MWQVSDLWDSEAESRHFGICLFGINQEKPFVLIQKNVSSSCYVAYSKRLSPFNVTPTPATKVQNNNNINF